MATVDCIATKLPIARRCTATPKAVAKRKIGEANVRLCPQFMDAEEFGFYSQRIPVDFFSIGINNAKTGKICHVHS